MSEDKKPFTVSDRRHFTPEGEARERTPAEPAAPLETEGRGEASPAAPGAEGPPLDFIGLLLSLGAQASLLLGHGPGTVEGSSPPDLPGARAIISLLEILKEKTEGHRTPEEDEVLEGILYELRMGYVASSRMGGA